jgi:hypothetical protein
MHPNQVTVQMGHAASRIRPGLGNEDSRAEPRRTRRKRKALRPWKFSTDTGTDQEKVQIVSTDTDNNFNPNTKRHSDQSWEIGKQNERTPIS